MSIEQVYRLQDINARYAEAIDDDRLETWPDFFADDGRYRITTAENVAAGLPLSLMYATSRASSTTCWMSGRSTTGSISFGIALVAGRKRVPSPATGKTALRTSFMQVPDFRGSMA